MGRGMDENLTKKKKRCTDRCETRAEKTNSAPGINARRSPPLGTVTAGTPEQTRPSPSAPPPCLPLASHASVRCGVTPAAASSHAHEHALTLQTTSGGPLCWQGRSRGRG